MATCKDCLHYQVCVYVMDTPYGEKEAPNVENVENDCQHFKSPSVEVVHGRWEDVIRGVIELGNCSECKKWQPVLGTNYCYNCGAKMDGGKKKMKRRYDPPIIGKAYPTQSGIFRRYDGESWHDCDKNGENEYVYDTNAVLESIDAQPTVDAFDVVWCKDCKHGSPFVTASKNEVWCCKMLVYAPVDGACSYGERRNDGEKAD